MHYVTWEQLGWLWLSIAGIVFIGWVAKELYGAFITGPHWRAINSMESQIKNVQSDREWYKNEYYRLSEENSKLQQKRGKK